MIATRFDAFRSRGLRAACACARLTRPRPASATTTSSCGARCCGSPHRADPALSAEARRLAVAWIADRRALDPGLADTVLKVAAATGDGALFDAMLAEARRTTDRLDRRNLLVALMSFRDAALAQRGLAAAARSGVRHSRIDRRRCGAATAMRRRAATVHAFIAAELRCACAARAERHAGRVARLRRAALQRCGPCRRRSVLARPHRRRTPVARGSSRRRSSRSRCAAGCAMRRARACVPTSAVSREV